MSQDHSILHDELKVPILALIGAAIVSMIGEFYATSEIIKILTVLFGEVSAYAKFVGYSSGVVDLVVMSIIVYGLYKCKGWARGAIMFLFVLQLVTALFGFYIVFVLNTKLAVIKIGLLTNFIGAVLAGYALYLLLLEDVVAILGKFKYENLALGAMLGLGYAMYLGVVMLNDEKMFSKADLLVVEIIKKTVFPRFCCESAISQNLSIYPNYPATTDLCMAMYNKVIDDCHDKVIGDIADKLDYHDVKLFMKELGECINTRVHEIIER